MAVKIKDVAKEANVSVATVSRVLNNIPIVNEETKKRVQDAIERTGYKPNAIARSLKMQKTNTFGIMIPDITRPYYTQIVRGVEDICNMYDYHIILCNTDANPEKQETYLDVLIEKQCDGILYIGKGISKSLKSKMLKSNVPLVMGGIHDHQHLIPSVMIDNEKAAYDIAEFLIEKGHRKIGYFSDHDQHALSAREREQGFRKALEKEGINFPEEWQKTDETTLLGGYKMMKELLKQKNRPTAIVAVNDEVALGAIKRAREEGIDIPKDISICGYNNYYISEWVSPSITTVAQPMYDIGAICARILIKMINGEELDSKYITVPHEIIERESTGVVNDL